MFPEREKKSVQSMGKSIGARDLERFSKLIVIVCNLVLENFVFEKFLLFISQKIVVSKFEYSI